MTFYKICSIITQLIAFVVAPQQNSFFNAKLQFIHQCNIIALSVGGCGSFYPDPDTTKPNWDPTYSKEHAPDLVKSSKANCLKRNLKVAFGV
jgi:hypothetical protein